MRRIIGLVAINIILVVALSIASPYFLTKANLVVMVNNIALEVIILSGYALLVIGGHFDLSVDGIVALSGVIAGLLLVRGVWWVLAIGVSLLVASSVGFINGVIVAKLKINGFIATLTTWWICIGCSLGMTKAVPPYGFPKEFQLLGQSNIFGFKSFVFCAIIVACVLSFVLHMTPTGVHLYASGDSPKSCERIGINISLLGIKMYTLLGFLSGFVGLLLASRLNAASPIAVDGMALRIIAALVIGGVGLSGGSGTIIGGLFGLLIMHIFNNAVVQLGISPFWSKTVLGLILLVAVLSEQLKFSTEKGRVSNA